MTTKPKAKKFRIRRSGSTAAAAAGSGASVQPARPQAVPPSQGSATPRPRTLNAMEEAALGSQSDGFGDRPFPTSAKAQGAQNGEVQNPGEAGTEAEIAAIRKEGLTGRQLRMARRLAQKHGLPATSDFDAVRLLRKAGIDPFQRSNMLELVSARPEPDKEGSRPAQLPQTVQKAQVPATRVMDAADRARTVMDMQRDIARRRQRKLVLLFTRLLFFVGIPTLIAGYYYNFVATPMYSTKSEFVIQKADGLGGGGLGGLFSGTGFATSQDSITVQSYLTSREAMLRLDQDHGFKSHFQQPEIDAIQRLAVDASNEAAYKVYKRNVKIGFDPTEGIIKMEVIAADPALSEEFSRALIRYAEHRVDELTERLRQDQMKGSNESYEEAVLERDKAQAEVLRLQEELAIYSADERAGAVMGRIAELEGQLLTKKLQLEQLLDNPRPNQARVDGARGDVKRLEKFIADLNAQLTEGISGGESIAVMNARLAAAMANLELRQVMMTQALEQRETARIEANKQTRYLELGVAPVAPDTPTYPRKFENTLLAFLIFAGIYLLLSLTVSILREQVSG